MAHLKIDTSVFKAYDVRGIYPKSLSVDLAYKIAVAYANLIQSENEDKKLKFFVSRDMRLSSPKLKDAVVQALVDCGVGVVDIGLNSTPSFYFAVAYQKANGGIQISASHNSAEYNGLKMVRAGAVPVSGEQGIYQMRDNILSGKLTTSKIKGEVIQREADLSEMITTQRQGINWQKIKPFKIIVDTANAMGVLDLKAIFRDLKCEAIYIDEKLDGTFPTHLADPLEEKNLEHVKSKVISQKADMGIATDGDGDRYFFIDERGNTVKPEILRGIISQIELKKYPGATICYDIRPGKITKEMIVEAGGKPVLTPVGHSLIKEAMLREDAVFGGESSGHFYYKFEYGTFESPTKFVLSFLAYLSEQNKTMSQIFAPYDKYFHSGEINSQVADAKAKLAAIVEKYSDGKVIKMDGITVEFDDFWFNVRSSNTQPLLRLNLEAVSQEIMEQRRDEVLKLIRS